MAEKDEGLNESGPNYKDQVFPDGIDTPNEPVPPMAIANVVEALPNSPSEIVDATRQRVHKKRELVQLRREEEELDQELQRLDVNCPLPVDVPQRLGGGNGPQQTPQ